MSTTGLVPLIQTDLGTFMFEHRGIGIHYPVLSECGRFPVSPTYYGFDVADTGGGCTAWRRDFTFNGEPVFMLITSAADATHEVSPFETIGLGVYADSCDWFVNWDQSSGNLDDCPPTNITKEGI